MKVAVIGGGVVGAACAYYLSKAGWTVTVYDRAAFGAGCSHANCGYVCPSHVLPLATPGAHWAALKSLFAANSPLKVKLRLDPALFTWFWKFARRCNRADMLAAGRAIQPLLTSSRALYEELLRDEGIDCQWDARGLLFVFHSAAGQAHYADTDRLLRDEFDLGAKRYDGEALTALEPALLPGLGGGWHYDTDAHLRPDWLMAELKRVLLARGVTLRENCPVKGFAMTGATATAVYTERGVEPADAFVLAAGAWTPQLTEGLGCRVPIQPGKGYSLTMPRPAVCPTIPLIFEEHRVAATPFADGYRLGSTMEFAGYDDSLNPARLALLTDAAKLYLHAPTAEPVQERWWGWRPMTPDSLPLIGRTPKLGNVVLAAGHNMLGLSMAPATGKLVAELLGAGTPHLDAGPYAVGRFC